MAREVMNLLWAAIVDDKPNKVLTELCYSGKKEAEAVYRRSKSE